MEAADFIGLSKKKCQDLCESKNMIFRPISVDGKAFFDYPEDVRTDRVCVKIVALKVTEAIIQ